mmetsp:Transcript_55766/g.135124  ORF Transcript_55766/g.135124 Transcript_55766/m.135124 type:complete len:321 (-) Transcript_55766:78-1040(-)
MFDVSWGEIFVVGAVGVALTGRKDLPAACRLVGTQIGRFVGLLQGARFRADQFAKNNELRQLQNELRAGLRELDNVKMELAVAASSQGVIGRKLGATTPSANKIRQPQQTPTFQSPSAATTTAATPQSSMFNADNAATTFSAATAPKIPPPSLPTRGSPSISSSGSSNQSLRQQQEQRSKQHTFDFDVQILDDDDNDDVPDENSGEPPPSSILPPAVQTERAVMEEEWEKQGIGFRAIGERNQIMNVGGDNNMPATIDGGMDDRGTAIFSGSELLERLERQNLIFDQYDRVVAERDAAMDERIRQVQDAKHKQDGDKSNR